MNVCGKIFVFCESQFNGYEHIKSAQNTYKFCWSLSFVFSSAIFFWSSLFSISFSFIISVDSTYLYKRVTAVETKYVRVVALFLLPSPALLQGTKWAWYGGIHTSHATGWLSCYFFRAAFPKNDWLCLTYQYPFCAYRCLPATPIFPHQKIHTQERV